MHFAQIITRVDSFTSSQLLVIFKIHNEYMYVCMYALDVFASAQWKDRTHGLNVGRAACICVYLRCSSEKVNKLI